jgi:PKD repeat protein
MYAFITGFIFSLVLMHAEAQNDVTNLNPQVSINSTAESAGSESPGSPLLDSCGANYVTQSVSGNPLGIYFIAQTSHSSNKNPEQVCWYFGDGRDTCINYNPNTPPPNGYATYHLYNNVGTFNVCVKILYQGGCLAYYCRTLTIGVPDSCGADFQALAANSNALTKYFVAQPSHNHNKKPTKVCWNFGDGRDTCILYSTSYTGTYATSHNYTQPGNYNVCVKIFYDGGCETQKCKSVQVGDPDSCGADFQVLAVSSTALGKYFIAQPSHNHNKKPIKVCWNFGDGRDTCIQYPVTYTGSYSAYHLYSQIGLYNVCVKIFYDGGCEAQKCKSVQIGNPQDSCAANFEMISTTANALNKYFVAQPWHNHNKKPVRVCWQFGDGKDTCIVYSTSYTGAYAVNHIYAQPGNYNVCVKILYDGGCEAQYCRNVQVGDPDSCGADFERLLTPTVNGLTVALKALPSHNHNRKPSRVCWQFGDGRDTCMDYAETFGGPYTVVHTYTQPGQYEVCVKIFYFGGCEARKCRNIIVPLPPDTCSVQMFESTPSITSLTRTFYAIASSSNTRRVTSICWYFGDGRDTCIVPTGISVIPIYYITHTYPGPGVYHPCVKVIFEGGCIAQKCIETVIRPATDICGGYFTDSLTAPGTFRFHGQGIHNPNDQVLNYTWNFGDGTSATGQDVTHSFPQATSFNVCLLINTAQGCETRICRRLQVGSNIPTLQLSPNPVISNLHVVFMSSFTETVTLRVVNSNGIAVRTYTKNAVTGSNVWDFDLSTLTPGIYSFVVQSPNQLASAIFLKQ